MKLYKIPGSFICCFLGGFGTGKTLALVEQALYTANALNLQIVANFNLNDLWCREFAKRRQLKNLVNKFRIIRRPSGKLFFDNLPDLLSQKQAVILLDEAGLELFSRDFKSKERQDLLKYIFQPRKLGSFIYYSAQDFLQVDSQVRAVTANWILCTSFQLFDKKSKHSQLVWRKQQIFDPPEFEQIRTSAGDKVKIIKPMLLNKFRFSWSCLEINRNWRFIVSLFSFFLQFHKFRFVFFPDGNLRLGFIGFTWSDFRISLMASEDILFKCYNSFALVKSSTPSKVVEFVPKNQNQRHDLNI